MKRFGALLGEMVVLVPLISNYENPKTFFRAITGEDKSLLQAVSKGMREIGSQFSGS